MASQAISRMAQARGRLILQQVFWAALVLSLPMREDPGCKTAWTDGQSIGFDPEFIESLEMAVVLFVIAHEACHVMLCHALRLGSRDPELWNVACDHAVNLLLKKCGFTIWTHALCDRRFEGMSAEQIYDILHKEQEQQGGQQGQPGSGPPQPGSGKAEQGGLGGDLRYVPMDPAKAREIEREVKARVVQAATQAKMCGQLPQCIAQAVDGLTNPPKRWQDIFRSYMRQPAADTENWARRNRRYTSVIMPGRWNLKMGEMVIIGDSSGSMCQPNIYAQMSVEINQIAESLKPTRTRIIWADDCDCSKQQVFEFGEKIVITPEGGGGTDMRKPLKYVERYNPLVVLLITDCCTPWPKATPYPLVVASTTDRKAPIGSTVHLPTR